MNRLGPKLLILAVYVVLSAQAFGICQEFAEVSGRSPSAAVLYKRVEHQIARQDKDEQGLKDLVEFTEQTLGEVPPGDRAPVFFHEAANRLFTVEMVAQKPDLIVGMKAAVRLSKAGAGQLIGEGNNDSWAIHNTASGVLGFSRLFDPEGKAIDSHMQTFKDAAAVYKPDTSYDRDNGWGLFFLGLNAVDRGRANGNDGLVKAGLAILDHPVLIEQRMEGAATHVESNPGLEAELKVRFGQMAIHFEKTPQELLKLRDQALKTVDNQAPESLVLGLLSLHLESGRSLTDLAKDLGQLNKDLVSKDMDFSPDQAIWALRVSRARGVSPIKAAMLMQEIIDADISKHYPLKPASGYARLASPPYNFSYHGSAEDAYLFGLLADTVMKPEAIVEHARNAMSAAVAERTDYGGSDRAASAMARMWLERTGYSPKTRYLVSQAMAGVRTQ